MDTLDYILKKYKIEGMGKMPFEIPNINREGLATLFAELDFTKGVEIGTEEGKYARILCEANPNLELICVDPWKMYENGKGYCTEISQGVIDGLYDTAKKRLSEYNCTLVREFSSKASEKFEDKSLDFVYIDGNHRLEYVIEDMKKWIPKVKKGGIISGHDYMKFTRRQHYSHVVEAIVAYTKAYHISPWFVLGARTKAKGILRDKHRSWLWVKK